MSGDKELRKSELCIAVFLINCDIHDDTPDYTGDSCRDLTRIVMIKEKLWAELFLNNKDYLINEIDNFSSEIDSKDL